MRIISGRFKGRSLLVSKNFDGRPTTDFAREGLFNVLNNLIDWNGISVLDLFAGTGAFGLECMSRGAEEVTFVDIQTLHLRFIGENIRQFELKKASTIRRDVFKYIEQISSPVNMVFADPPYNLPQLPTLPDLILNEKILTNGGLFVLEHGKRNSFTEHPFFLQVRTYGNVSFSFFRRSV